MNTKLKYNADKLVIFGFIGSLLGDIFLIFEKWEPGFILGLVSFATSHIFYIMLFAKCTYNHYNNNMININSILLLLDKKSSEKINKADHLPCCYASVGVFAYMGGLISYLLPLVEADLKIPVVFYCCVIAGMLLTTLFRRNYTSNRSWVKLVTGALLFVVSDSVLAVGKFGKMEGSYQRLTVMVTYYIA